MFDYSPLKWSSKKISQLRKFYTNLFRDQTLAKNGGAKKLLDTAKAEIFNLKSPTLKKLKAVFDWLISLKTISCGLAILAFILIAYRWNQDRKVVVFFNQTTRNKRIMRTLGRLITSYNPTFWMPGALIKGIYLGYATKSPYKGMYLRQEVELDDGEVLAVDFYPKDHFDKEVPTIMLMPGIMGESMDYYSIELCRMVEAATGGWRVGIMHRRGYGGMPTRGSYVSSFHTVSDMQRVLGWVKTSLKGPIYLLGLSMGAGQTQKYLEVYEKEVFVDAAVTVASTWDMEHTSNHISKNWLVTRFLADFALDLIKRHLHDPHYLKLLEEKGIDESKAPTKHIKLIFSQFFDFRFLTHF